jgi:hypothetical protein
LSARKFLDDQLQELWLGEAGPIPWLSRFIDLTPLVFFWTFWKDVKDCVSVPPLRAALPELKNLICEAVF